MDKRMSCRLVSWSRFQWDSFRHLPSADWVGTRCEFIFKDKTDTYLTRVLYAQFIITSNGRPQVKSFLIHMPPGGHSFNVNLVNEPSIHAW